MAISYIEAETHCASCQSVVHINALTNKLVCAACHEPVRVWVNVFEDIGRPFHDCAYPATSEMPVAQHMRTETSDLECAECQGPLPANLVIAQAEKGSYPCPGCGVEVRVRARPDDAPGSLTAAAKYIIGEDPVALGEANPTPPPAATQIKCTECGAALSVDGSKRSVECSYCHAPQTIADGPWRVLHPPPKKRRWYVWLDDAVLAAENRNNSGLIFFFTLAIGIAFAFAIIRCAKH